MAYLELMVLIFTVVLISTQKLTRNKNHRFFWECWVLNFLGNLRVFSLRTMVLIKNECMLLCQIGEKYVIDRRFAFEIIMKTKWPLLLCWSIFPYDFWPHLDDPRISCESQELIFRCCSSTNVCLWHSVLPPPN